MSKPISDWSIEETAEWFGDKFNIEIAEQSSENKFTGEEIITIYETKCSDVLEKLGLSLLDVVAFYREVQYIMPGCSQPHEHRETKLNSYQRKLYNAKKNKIYTEALLVWSGNTLPIFKNHEENLELLDNLVKKCSPYQFPEIGFDSIAVRKYVVDLFAQRRKRRKNGTDFDKPDGRKCKKVQRVDGNDNDQNNKSKESENSGFLEDSKASTPAPVSLVTSTQVSDDETQVYI